MSTPSGAAARPEPAGQSSEPSSLLDTAPEGPCRTPTTGLAPTHTARIHTPTGGAVDASHPAYQKRLARAKTMNKSNIELGAERAPNQFSLNLSGLSASLGEPPAEGDHKLGGGDQGILTTPRADQDVAITVRGAPKHKQRKLFKLGPDTLGTGPLKFAWRPGGQMIATASMKGGALMLLLLRRDGTIYNRHTLGDGKCVWLEWESKGHVLGLHQAGCGIFLWEVPPGDSPELTAPMALCPSITINASFCKWSKVAPQLAIGTQQGKVIIFNKGEGVMQLHEKKGKHGAPVTCGDWLFDNRLGLASGLRVKISQPVAETSAKWESYSKFRLGGMLSKVPKHIRSAGAPSMLQFTPGYPPFVAVAVGAKYLLTFDTTRVHEDLGLTFPEDYGSITGFRWLQNNVLIVGLTNGYIVTVDFDALIKLQQSNKLPDRVSAMCTTKVFNEYLQDISAIKTSDSGQRVACCGDCSVKVVHRTGMEFEVLLEVSLDRKPTIGEFLDKVEWDDTATGFACSATDGFLYVHELLGV